MWYMHVCGVCMCYVCVSVSVIVKPFKDRQQSIRPILLYSQYIECVYITLTVSYKLYTPYKS